MKLLKISVILHQDPDFWISKVILTTDSQTENTVTEKNKSSANYPV